MKRRKLTAALVQDEELRNTKYEWRAKRHAILYVNYWSITGDLLHFPLLNGTS